MEETWLSVTQCASRLGVTRATVHKAIQRGDIQARRIGNSYVIKADDCEAYTPVMDPKESGRIGAERRWGKPEDTTEEKAADLAPKRPRGRPKKKEQ